MDTVVAKEYSAESILRTRGKHTVKTGYKMPGGEMRPLEVEMTGEKGLNTAISAMVPAGGWDARAKGEMDWDRAIVEKFGDGMTLAFEKGVEDEPILYDKIFRTMPGSAFTNEIVPIQDLLGIQAAFTIVKGGESVSLAEWKYGEDSTARFYTYGAGYVLTRDDLRWNKYFKAAQAAHEMGQAYNRGLNNIHFAPIFAYSYTGAKLTSAVTNANLSAFERVWATLYQASQDIPEQKDAVFGSRLNARIGICNRKTAALYNMINAQALTVRGSEYRPIDLFDELVIYDGSSGTINGVKYDYAGPADNEIYAVEPKKKFVSVMKESRTSLQQQGNVLKLEDMQYADEFVVLHAEDVANGAHKIVLPAVDVNAMKFVTSVTINNQVATPVPSAAAGAVADNSSLTLSCPTSGATIFYTADGSTPTLASTRYSTAITITDAVTIKAIAVKSGMTDSDTMSAAYTIA